MTLRKEIIRLAHANPYIRQHLLPLLKVAIWEDMKPLTEEVVRQLLDNPPADIRKPGFGRDIHIQLAIPWAKEQPPESSFAREFRKNCQSEIRKHMGEIRKDIIDRYSKYVLVDPNTRLVIDQPAMDEPGHVVIRGSKGRVLLLDLYFPFQIKSV